MIVISEKIKEKNIEKTFIIEKFKSWFSIWLYRPKIETAAKIGIDIKKDIVYSKNDVFLDFSNKYKVSSKNLVFDRANKKIFSNEETIIDDNQNNEYFLKDNFNFFLDKEIITAQSSLVKDKFNNKYI